MKKSYLFLISTLSVMLLSACHHEKLQKLGANDTILAFGDSLTYGYGAAPEESWPSVLEKLTSHHVINAGVNGDTTAGGKHRLAEVLEDNHPSLVILSLGGNDLLRHNDLNQTLLNTKDMIDMIQAKGIQVALLAEPQPQLAMRLHDAKFYEEIAQEKKIVVLDDIYSSLLSKNENKSDLIHLNAKGYNQAAEEIAEQLKSDGAL